MFSLNDVADRLADAEPGDVLVLAPGTYSGEDCVLSGKGKAGMSIVIRAEAADGVRFTSPVLLASDFVTLEGIVFEKDGGLEVEGTGCRITRCVWSDAQTGKWIRVRPGSAQIEIDHCRFENKTNNLRLPRGCQLMQIVVRNQGENHHIHHNHFVDVPKGLTNNGYETLQLITENNPFDPAPGDCGTVIEENLFERCDGEAEIISVKSNGNILRKNTFRGSKGSLVLRHGDGNVVTQNGFFGDGASGTGGVRLQGEDQVVMNNLFHSIGKFGVAMMDGTPDDLYIQTQRARILFNTFVGCSPALEIGVNHSKHPNGTPPRDCVIANNLIVAGGDDSPEALQTVRYVRDDEPENWLWEGNVTNGSLGIPAVDGLRQAGVSLEYRDDGVPLPLGDPAMAAVGVYEEITDDLFGRARDGRKTIGCLEAGDLDGQDGPPGVSDVGPESE